MSKTIIIDYGGSNVHSVQRALLAAGATETILTADPAEITKAERLIFPGQGAFGQCAAALNADFRAALQHAVKTRRVPFLGICLGMQIMAENSDEAAGAIGLSWIAGNNIHLQQRADNQATKFPHMGWAALQIVRLHPVLSGLASAYFYYAHSYVLRPSRADQIIGTSDYGGAFTAIAAHENMIGVQFHPEKSQQAGLQLLQQFLIWQPQ